ncbi:hypothetical protein ACQPW1_46315 [Nocardia sp. CA-128927]|uniref:hypothetical protein n=1 Tax=Nocardia sp. CA-128927 TaxID=3239975 RepID=UPI003D97CEED
MPVAHAEPAKGDANVAVFKVSHIDGSVIAAYDCTKGDTATITVKVSYKTTGKEGSGTAKNLKCSGDPTFVTVETDLGAGKHGDEVSSKISIKAGQPDGADGLDGLDGAELVENGSFSTTTADGTDDSDGATN